MHFITKSLDGDGLELEFTILHSNFVDIDFGDGTSQKNMAHGKKYLHKYPEPGKYLVTAIQTKASIEIYSRTLIVGDYVEKKTLFEKIKEILWRYLAAS